MKKIYTIIVTLILCANIIINAQNVYIPDANFKAVLVANTLINTNKDTAIQMSEAVAYKGSINVSYKNIKDLSGIEAFTALTNLNCNNNQLTTLDLSANTALTNVECRNNVLKSLNITANKTLTNLYPDNNQLTALDISSNTSLVYFTCTNNQLTYLNLSTIGTLAYFNCNNNVLTALNLQNGSNTKLTYFTAINNPALTCIQVDSVAYMIKKWTNVKDKIASYNTNCNYTVGIDVETNTNAISIYPNPANNLITLGGIAESNQTINITNIVGETMQTAITNGTSKVDVNVSNLPNGLYFISMGNRSLKFIKD